MNNLYCLIGPSGAGKDAIKFASNLPYVVSYRTRPMRAGEEEGVDGYFIGEDLFLKMNDHWVAKTEYAGNLYGITKAELTTLKYSPMIYVIDWKGFQYLKHRLKEIGMANPVVSIFVDASPKQLQDRMVKQGRHQVEIEERMKRIFIDMTIKDKCDFVIDNRGSIDEAIEQFQSILTS